MENLSQTFGENQSIIVLPGNADTKLYPIYKKVLEQWNTSADITIISDQVFEEKDFKGKVVWILGMMNELISKFFISLPDEIEITDKLAC